ncbi:MAG: nucleotidyltransferase domain-containing protein [Candidatus Caenarcaniphilales bacterium]|nr:nucleotidyltransferase domain-containing protein [Candidatus Caenarcaniphilales bacterium]
MKLLHHDFKHGLSNRSIRIIQSILEPYQDIIEEVKVFGSRANDNYKEYSDLDLVIFGNLNEKDEDRLWTLFSESSLAIKVDVKIYQNITYKALKDHIDQNAKTLLTKP